MPVVDIGFRLQAVLNGGPAALPADSAYALLAAVSRVVPVVHANEAVGIHPLAGHFGGSRDLVLNQVAHLVIRAPHELLPELLALAGRALVVNGCRLMVGLPEVRALVPAPRLYARQVTIKHALSPETMLAGVRAQLTALEVEGEPRLVRRQAAVPVQGGRGGAGEWVRRTLRVADKEIVGYAVELERLTPAGSLAVQSRGIGGRRRLGCGIFVPARETTS